MDKRVEYRNIDEFIKITFPNIYQEKKISNDTSLESFIKKNSEDFKLKINNIIQNKKQNDR